MGSQQPALSLPAPPLSPGQGEATWGKESGEAPFFTYTPLPECYLDFLKVVFFFLPERNNWTLPRLSCLCHPVPH